jgi:cell division protein FtsB
MDSRTDSPRKEAASRGHPFLRRLFWNILPATFIVGTVGLALLGDKGLLERHALKQHLAVTQDHITRLEQENRLLRAQIHRLETDPLVAQRTLAETLYLAPEGSTIYRFPDP